MGAHRGPEHHFWKGDAVGYKGIHMWVSYHKGKASVCETAAVPINASGPTFPAGIAAT
jgi:hypothetical protein